MTLFANDLFLSVARPRSPILTEPEVPVTKMLSHLRSRWMTGGVRVCRKLKPFKIWRHQFFSGFALIFRKRLMYLKLNHAIVASIYLCVDEENVQRGVYWRLECSWRHQLGDEHDFAVSTRSDLLPRVVKTHDVGMLQTLEHLSFLLEALSFRLTPLFVL